MADLPRILARPDLPTVSLPRVSPEAAGRPWAQLSQAAGEWEKMLAAKEKEAPVEAALKSSEYNIKVEQWKNEAQVEQQADGTFTPADPATWLPNFRAKEKQGRAEFLADVKDRRVSDFVNLHANRAIDEHVKELNKRALETVQGQAVAKVKTAGELYAQHSASTDSQVLKDLNKQNFEALIKTATSPTRIGNQIFPPAWTKGEEIAARELYAEREEKLTAYFRLDNDPERLREDLKDPKKFTRFTGPERQRLDEEAKDKISEKKKIIKEGQQELNEAKDREFLRQNIKGTLTEGQIIADNTLSPQRLEHWRDVLHRQAKERAKENQEDNPFEKSDGATRARVMQGVFTNPHEWPPDRIMSYIGKGLSNTHAHQLVEDQMQLTKDKTGGASKKYDPLNRAMTTLEGMRRTYMFTVEGVSAEPGKVTDRTASGELRAKNDFEYGKVADRVRAAHANGEDPQVALQREMKPYFENKTKGWFEKMSQFFTQPRTAEIVESPEAAKARQERDKSREGLDTSIARHKQEWEKRMELRRTNPDEAARQFLLENGKAVTPASIQRTKEYFRQSTDK